MATYQSNDLPAKRQLEETPDNLPSKSIVPVVIAAGYTFREQEHGQRENNQVYYSSAWSQSGVSLNDVSVSGPSLFGEQAPCGTPH